MAIQIGELRARLVAEATQMKQEVQAVKMGVADLGEEGKKTSKSFTDLNTTMSKVAANTDQLKAIEQQLKKIDPAKVEQGLAEVVAELQKMGAERKQVEALEKALAEMSEAAKTSDIRIEDLEQELKKLKDQLEDTRNETDKTTGGFNTLASGIAALGSGATFAKLVNLTQTLAGEANQLANSYRGLSVVSEKFNVDSEGSIDLAEKLANRWGLNKGTMADVVKTYLTMNLTLEEAERIITATADAAAYNRQAHLSWDEAIKQVAEGVKAGNSNLTDAAGITTNLSVMQERYAKSIGTTAAKLTEAGKVQAAYNGMLEEGAIFAGNADDAMTGFTGTQASFQSTLQEARTELGEAYIPALETLLGMITPLIKDFSLWAAENKETVAGLTAAGIAVTGLIAVLSTLIAVAGALKMAMIALNLSFGPIGWFITSIGLVTLGVAAYKAAADATTESIWKFAQSQEELNRKLNESPLKRSAQDVKDLMDDIERLNKLLERQKELEEQLQKEKESPSGGNIFSHWGNLKEIKEELKEINNALSELDAETPEKAAAQLERMNKAMDDSITGLLELERATLREVGAQIQHIDKVEALRKRYNELNNVQKLDVAQKEELKSVVKQLAQEYPGINAALDEHGRWIIENKGYLEDLIQTEKDAAKATSEKSKERLESWKAETQAKLELAKAQVKALSAIAEKDLSETKLGKKLPSSLVKTFDFIGDLMLTGAAKQAQENANNLQLTINEIDKDIQKITSGSLGKFEETKLFDEGKEKEKKGKTLEQLQQEQYQAALALIEYKKNLNQMSTAEELVELQKLEEKYKKNADIRMDAEVRVYKLKQQMNQQEYNDALKLIQYKKDLGKMSEKAELSRLEALQKKYKDNNEIFTDLEVKIHKLKEQMEQKDFQNSNKFIEREGDRMKLAGKNEQQITQYKIRAWTQVRDRHEKDSEFYKQADDKLTKLKIENMNQIQKKEEEAAKERERISKDSTKKALAAIDKAKKAELDALDERRKAIKKFYDDQTEVIDDSERLKERNELVAEMEKYRFATSERGQKTFLELQEKLRQMDVEQQKRNLDKQRDQELEVLDRQKKDIETFYDDLRAATEDLTGDLTTLYKLADDERLNSFKQTNEKIKQEMAALQQALSSYQAYKESTPSSGVAESVKKQMQANSSAWGAATPEERARLEADNASLGTSQGWIRKADGRWYYPDGKTKVYHTGGIAGEMNFRSPEQLMPDEIVSILRRSETVLTPEQIGSLISVGQSDGRAITHNYYGPLIENSGDVHLQDNADIESYSREQDHLVRQLIARGERADG